MFHFKGHFTLPGPNQWAEHLNIFLSPLSHTNTIENDNICMI